MWQSVDLRAHDFSQIKNLCARKKERMYRMPHLDSPTGLHQHATLDPYRVSRQWTVAGAPGSRNERGCRRPFKGDPDGLACCTEDRDRDVPPYDPKAVLDSAA